MYSLRMAAYCRVSTRKEAQLDSLAHQKEFFQQYAKKEQFYLTKIYADEGLSGKSQQNRTEFQRMLQDAEQGCFDLLAVKDISRFARNTVDCLQAVRRLKKCGVAVRFLSSGQENMGDSEFILTVYASLAQEESANLSKRIQFGKEINARKGRVPPQIYGYKRTGIFTLEIEPKEAAVIRLIFQKYLQGNGTAQIAAFLNKEGYPTKHGKQWNAKGIRRCLDNPIYCGIFVNHKTQVTDFLEGTVSKLPETEYFYHQRPSWAIVSREEFAAVQEERERRRNLLQFGKAKGRNRNT